MGASNMRKSLLGGIVLFIIGIVVLIAIAFAIVFAFVQMRYDVNLVSVVRGVKELNKPVDEDKLCPNKCTEDDLIEAHDTLNYNGSSCVQLNPDRTLLCVKYPDYCFLESLLSEPDTHLKITDKQLGGVIDRLWTQEDGLDIKVGDKGLDVSMMSFKVLRRYNYEWTEFQAVLKVDFGPVKEKLKDFPAKTLKKYIPDVVYITSEARITSTDSADIYAYTIDPLSLKLNNLSEKKSEEIIDALDSFIKFGDTNQLSTNIWTSIMRVVVGVRKDGNEIAGIGAGLKASCWATSLESISSGEGNKEKYYIMFFQYPQF